MFCKVYKSGQLNADLDVLALFMCANFYILMNYETYFLQDGNEGSERTLCVAIFVGVDFTLSFYTCYTQ